MSSAIVNIGPVIKAATATVVVSVHIQKGGCVARRANYGFEKRQRELEKKKKKEAKREAKRLQKEAAALAGAEPDGESDLEFGAETDPATEVASGSEVATHASDDIGAEGET